jgi:hypothetical protein
MTGTAMDDLTGELRDLLTRDGLYIAANLLFVQNDDRLNIQIMAATSDSLGVLLATLSDPGELDDPGSLSRRIAPGDVGVVPGKWTYGLHAGRYPTSDRGLWLQVTVSMPAGDLPAVVSRLADRR